MAAKRSFQGTALVTGGAKRIGQAMALKLSSLGYKIALHYHHSKREAQETQQVIVQHKGVCELFACDLADEAQVQSLLPAVFRKFTDLNLLINNASVFEKNGSNQFDLNLYNRHMNINLKSPYILIAAFAELCLKGNIINILDTHIVDNKSAYLAYLLSKKALWELTKLAASTLAPQIRVNAVAPGLILPPVGQTDTYIQRLAQRIPLRRKGDIEHILLSIQFLLENPFLTGQVIFADGGQHLL